jgi:hypothetical protein
MLIHSLLRKSHCLQDDFGHERDENPNAAIQYETATHSTVWVLSKT